MYNTQVKDEHGNEVEDVPRPLTLSNLDKVPASTYLSVLNTSSSYAPTMGQNPTTNSVPVYTFIVPKEGGIVDLFYWIFTPYNVGKTIPALGTVGSHVGDWERMMVRTLNGK